MSTKDQIVAALETMLEPGEQIMAWRPVVANGKVADRAYETTLALLGPSVFARSASGSMTNEGAMPDRTNLVVVTDRRLLWCHKSRLSNDTQVLGADALAAVGSVEFVPARIALAKLRFTFHDWSVVEFDLSSDHRAAEFADDIASLLPSVRSAA